MPAEAALSITCSLRADAPVISQAHQCMQYALRCTLKNDYKGQYESTPGHPGIYGDRNISSTAISDELPLSQVLLKTTQEIPKEEESVL